MTKKISIATTDFHINGNLLNAIDMQNYFGCDLYILKYEKNFIRKYLEMRKTIYRKMIAKPYSDIQCEILIVDYKTFMYMLMNNFDITCDKLIVLDCLELSLHQQLKVDNRMFLVHGKYIPDIELMSDVVFPNTEIQFLMPKVNYDKWEYKFKADIFYKKINFNSMNIPAVKNNDFVYREDRMDNSALLEKYPMAKPATFGNSLYESRNFIYSRRSHLSYIEQFGRILFELYYFGRNVYTFSDIFNKRDGLTEHLQLLNSYLINDELKIPDIETMNMNNYNYMEKYI